MANWQGMILTTKGRALQSKVEAGKTLLSLTKIKLGDGVISGSQTLEALTDLVSPKQIIGITTIDPQSTGICKITGTVTNVGLENGYNIKELGLFATDPEAGEILYAITTDSNFDYLQAEGGATIVSEEFNLSITISNASQVTATIDATGLLTVSSATVLISQLIAAHNVATDAHADIRAALKKAGGVSIGTIMPFLSTKPQPGWLALDTGALVSRATYPDLWTWVQANAPLISETDWQTQAAAQTSVGAYSTGDGSTTFRLPRIVDFVSGSTSSRTTGTWRNHQTEDLVALVADGNDMNIKKVSYSWTSDSNAGDLTNTSSTAKSQTYGTAISTLGTGETRPKSIAMLYCVKAFDAEANNGLIDITELANEMAGKVNLTDFTGTNQGKSANGWQKLPGGLILQWGQATSGGSGTNQVVTVTLPIAFPNAFLCGQVTYGVDHGSTVEGFAITNQTSTNFRISHSGDNVAGLVFWFAIGY